MRYEKLSHSNTQFSKIILGTWQAGKNMWADIDDADIIKAVQSAMDVGISTIDTAPIYGDSYSEKIIARALNGISRQKYEIATKVFSDKLKYQQVLDECHKSLKNLKTTYIDLYQIHWPSGSFGSKIVPIEETMKALCELKKDGKILNIGVSNFSHKQIQEAEQYGEIVSNQPPYSLIWRTYDKETNPYCRKNNISILAYSPLAQGILTGKINKNHKFKEGDHRNSNKLLEPNVFYCVEKVLDGLQKYADKYATSLGNIALQWLVSQPNTFAIVGARNAEQVLNNAKVYDFQLTHAELIELDALSELVTKNMVQVEPMWNW